MQKFCRVLCTRHRSKKKSTTVTTLTGVDRKTSQLILLSVRLGLGSNRRKATTHCLPHRKRRNLSILKPVRILSTPLTKIQSRRTSFHGGHKIKLYLLCGLDGVDVRICSQINHMKLDEYTQILLLSPRARVAPVLFLLYFFPQSPVLQEAAILVYIYTGDLCKLRAFGS
jgi:hypothetical protein